MPLPASISPDTLRVFLTDPRPCRPTALWPHTSLSLLLSDSLHDLYLFAAAIMLPSEALAWSDHAVPYFPIAPAWRDVAVRRGAMSISHSEELDLTILWEGRSIASLKRITQRAGLPPGRFSAAVRKLVAGPPPCH